MNAAEALSDIPEGLRKPLLAEYAEIVKNFTEHRWAPAELSGGKFCEIVYTVLRGHAAGAYDAAPSKPGDFPTACKQLENNLAEEYRSLRILIPRMLPPLYDIRNNRGVGHVGGDVDPNHMDATAVLSMCNWIMAELVRVFHGLSVGDAQDLVDRLAERQIPLIWQSGEIKRILAPGMKVRDQALVFLAVAPGKVPVNTLMAWIDYKNGSYFRKLMREMAATRHLFFHEEDQLLEIMPPGSSAAAELVRKWAQNFG